MCAARAAPSTDLPTDKFDYIIVGGGLSGCLLANRLSADPSKRVLLLEAGENNTDPIVKVPTGITRLFKHPTLDWNLQTTSQPTMGGRESYLARGKLLGGSSSTNATLYHRGASGDYDKWGLPGWGADDVLPWFKAAEDNPCFGNGPFHAVGGAMHVEKPIYQNELYQAYFDASKAIGMQQNPDFNDWSREQEGFGDFQVAITQRGRRADAFRQFLQPVLDRDNLTVVTHAQTSKVLFETVDGTPRAVGVQVQSIQPGAATLPTGRSATVSVKAGGEVVLAAGAVHTPQILMLSGIGPRASLANVGVDCVSDLAGVGANLQDHPAVLTAFTLKESVGKMSITDEIYNAKGDVKLLQLLNWAVLGKGPLTSTGCDRGAFVRTDASKALPDLQLRFVPGCALNPDGVGSYADFGRWKAAGKSWPSGITFQIIAVRPESSGSLTLRSASITDQPLIDLAYCTDAAGADAATLRAGIRMSRDLAAAPALAAYVADEVHPGAGATSDEALDEYMQRTMHSANAVVGTCAMGPAAKGGVVSPVDMSVHGVAGLRVIDASVLPSLPGGQTGAPTVMIAERAATMMVQGQAGVGKVAPALAMA